MQAGLAWWVVLLALAVLAALAAGYWKWRQPAAGAAGPSAAAGRSGPGGRFGPGVQAVSVGVVQQRDMRVTVQALGTVTATRTVVVRARVDGELQSVTFQEGQPVKAGQVLAQIDPRPLQAALEQAQGTLAKDSAQLKNAQIDLKRYRDLLAQDSIAEQQVAAQEALVRQLQGTVQADTAQVDSARLQLSYTRITAPLSGRAGLRQVDAGNIIHAADTNGLVTITQTDPINVVFAVPDAQLGLIRSRLAAREPLPVQALDGTLTHTLAQGNVMATDNLIDATTGTIKIKAELRNPQGALFPNQFVNVRLQTGTLSNALVVPSAAVQLGAQGSFVYVVKPDSTVTVRAVRAGASDAGVVSVQGDLAVGDRVVTDGADRLREGAKVEVIAPASAVPASAASAALPASSSSALRDRLTPAQREQLQKMSPEERRAYFSKLRAAPASDTPASGAR